jgi:hypothetical protein
MFFCLNHNRTRESMLFVAETQNLRRLLNINKRVKMMTRWLMKTNILAQFSLTIECLEWFRSVMWAKRMHTESTKKSQYFAFKTITRRLDDERAERNFYFSEDFSLIHIVYSNFRMNRLKSMTQRVWNIIIINHIIEKTLLLNSYSLWHRHQTIHAKVFTYLTREKNLNEKEKSLVFNSIAAKIVVD